MLNNNLQVNNINRSPFIKPANKQVKSNISFKGTAYQPLRPEYYTIKFDDELISSKKLIEQQNKGFLGKIADAYKGFMESLVKDSDKYIKKEQLNNYPFEYKLKYYA